MEVAGVGGEQPAGRHVCLHKVFPKGYVRLVGSPGAVEPHRAVAVQTHKLPAADVPVGDGVVLVGRERQP
eukprot:scaffold17799_cov43-Prasinocladus_malaysianus.AAC.4